MANRHFNQPSRLLSVLVIVLFKGVESYRGGINKDISVYEYIALNIHDPKPSRPVENCCWRSPENLGEISGVAVNPDGYPVIFHRGDRTWSYDTFNEAAEYQEEYKGPIQINTVLTLDFKTGDIISGWGNHTFYLPHGIHIDKQRNIWLTDVALHQVFKFSPSGGDRLMTLGQKFEPGNDLEHFCQPTAVAVLPNNEIVIADGYCNHRILMFDKEGNPKYSINEEWIPLNVPHALTVLPNRQVCVADREHWRIVCLPWEYKTNTEASQDPAVPYLISNEAFGRIFGIASYHGTIYAVNGATLNSDGSKIQVRGFIVDPLHRNITGVWGPETSSFENPHAIAACPYGSAIYVSEIGPNKIWKFDLRE